MSIEQDNGKPARLSLAERAKQGLLLSKPDLALDEVLALEHPGDLAGRKALSSAIRAAIQYGDLPATIRQWQRPGLLVNRDWLRLPPIQNKPTQCSETRLERDTYRAWRAQCPVELLSPLSKIHKWLGAMPPAESPLPLDEQARPGLLLSELLELEHSDAAARLALKVEIERAIKYKKISAVYVPLENEPGAMLVFLNLGDWLIDRESYRQWRTQCPARLLSDLSHIGAWLGAMPARPESILPVETSLPERRQRQDALNHAIRAAIAVLSPSGDPLPQPRALFDYLRTADQTKTVIDSSKEQLTWYSAETGRKQTATIANLKKRLDRWID